MAYSYDRTAAHRTAHFLVRKLVVDVDVNLDPDKLSWTTEGKILMVGKASFVLPHNKYESQPYEMELTEDGTLLRCTCPDPMHRQLVSMAARDRKHELVELIEDQKTRGGLRKRASAGPYVVKWQNRGRQPNQQELPTKERAFEYGESMLKNYGKAMLFLAVEIYDGDVLVEKKMLKGTASPAEKKLEKLRKDLAKLKENQERAVGALNKAEFDEDIEWTEAQIAKLERL